MVRNNDPTEQPQFVATETAKRAYLLVWQRRYELILPIIVLVVFSIARVLLFQGQEIQPERMPGPQAIGHFLIFMVWAILAFAFQVGLLRSIVVGEVRNGIGWFRIDRYFFRTIWATIQVTLVCAAYGLIFGLLAGILIAAVKATQGTGPKGLIFLSMLIGVFFFIQLTFRLYLVTIAAAVGDEKYIRLSWTATKGRIGWLFSVVFFVMTPFLAIQFLLWMHVLANAMVALLYTGAPVFEQPGLPSQLLLALIGTIALPFTTSAGAICYKILVPREKAPTESSGIPIAFV